MKGISKLRRYLKDKGISAHAFALQNQMDPSEIAKILRGERTRISVTVAVALEKATRGAVRCEDWVE